MRKRLTKKTKIILCILSAIFFALLIWTIWGNTALTVSNIKISSSRIPPAFSGFRIAQVSDLHNAEFGKGNKKLLELLSESKPDIIVITGDFVDAGHTDIDVALDFAKGAVSIAPVYYVTGNHEAILQERSQFCCCRIFTVRFISVTLRKISSATQRRNSMKKRSTGNIK